MTDAEGTPAATPAPGGTSLTLLQRLRTNQPDAWREMVYLYTPLVYRWCAQLGVRGADADDVSQEVFRGAAAGVAGFRRERAGDSFRGWLRGITRNMVLLHFRSRGRRTQASGDSGVLLQLHEIIDPASLPADEDDPPSELDGLYRRALELVRREFEERTWHAFWQTVAEGRPPVDVAADLDVTPAAVRKAKSRVLRRLKEQFGDLIQ
jgi:RNA polymerase sigma-70 factor (ECF subfamily)